MHVELFIKFLDVRRDGVFADGEHFADRGKRKALRKKLQDVEFDKKRISLSMKAAQENAEG